MVEWKKELVVSDVKENVVPVDNWKAEGDDKLITHAGKCIIIPFDKLIDKVNKDTLNIFYISFKDSYVKRLAQITDFLNYFIKYYDDDNELIMNYLHCKYMIDHKKTKPSRKGIIKWLYKRFVTDSMYKKVQKYVNDNYRIDLAQNKEADKQYSESLEFTNKHAKELYLISAFIKMLIPLVMHYISVIKGKPEVKKLIKYYKPLFELVYEKDHVNLYAKMFHSILVKVIFSESNNPVIWGKYAANSLGAEAYAEELLDKNIIVDNVFKFNFDRNIISFNNTIIKTQLEYRCVKNFGINMREISTEKDNDGLSYLDKLEMNMYKVDENNIILSKINIKNTIKKLQKKFRFKISKEEVEFYKEYSSITTSVIGKTLVFYFYAKYFGGYVDLKQIGRRKYIKLLILMKKWLALNGYIYLNQIISANVGGRINNRMIRNNRNIEKAKRTETYNVFEKEKYSTLENSGKEDSILSPLITIMNTQFYFVDYDEPEKLNRPLKFNFDILEQEWLDFVDQI